MDFEIDFSPKSEEDLWFIIDYYNELSPSSAKKYYYGIIDRVEKLIKHPRMGRPVPEFIDIFYDKYRELIYETFRIIYRIENKTIIIIRIVDGRTFLDQNII